MSCPRWPTVARTALLMTFALLLTCGVPAAVQRQRSSGETPLSKLPPEVRLRKLHLVRPDLIQYPIYYEVYC